MNFIHSTKNGVILRNESVCTTSEKLHGIIETGQFAMVEFWYFHQLNYNADCYFWCNSEENFATKMPKISHVVVPSTTEHTLVKKNSISTYLPTTISYFKIKINFNFVS